MADTPANRFTGQTPSQTVGPYYHLGLTPESVGAAGVVDADLTGGDATESPTILVTGRLLDGTGAGVSDGLVEVWQADPEGRYATDGFRGFGRVKTDAQGRFSFRTVKPGAVTDGRNRMQAPHLNLTVFARGLLNHVFTRCYFPDDPTTGDDPVLGTVPADRRATLVATDDGDGRYRFDIHLQGPSETVFFDL